MYSLLRSHVQYVALSSPDPNSIRISKSSSDKISFALTSSTSSGSPLTNNASGADLSVGINETETREGSILNVRPEVYPTAQRIRPQLASDP